MASTYLTNGLTAGSGTIGTVSLWVKRSNLSTSTLYHFWEDNTTWCRLRFDSSDVLHWETRDNGTVNGKFKTNRVFRDTSAYYHIVVRVDTTQSTEADRFKLYVNGSEETSFSTSTYPTQNRDVKMTAQPYIGVEWDNSSGTQFFDGIMTHVHYTDGQSYAASTFGQTDSTSGIWKPKTAPSVTYGSKGFFLKFENSGAMGTDSSGNGNNFTTIGGALKQSSDTPSNNFITWNANKKLTITLSNGSTTTSGNGDNGVWSTIGNNQGKWYWETQQNANSVMMGIIHEDVTQTTGRSQSAGAYGLQSGNGSYAYYRNNGSSGQSSGFPEITNSNVLCHALDLDNGKYFLGIDGVFKNLSGTTSNVGTGADPTFTGLDTTKLWFPFTESRGTGVGCDANFGSGFFGTTAVTSANADANGHGAFEYAVPSGYYTLNTKNIKELG